MSDTQDEIEWGQRRRGHVAAGYSTSPSAGPRTALASAVGIRMSGTMLWFNAAKDLGVLETNDGERIQVPGSAFEPEHKPVGRCAGKAVECELRDGAPSRIAFVAERNPRRARRRHR